MKLIRMGQKMNSFQVETAKEGSSPRNDRYHEIHFI